MPPLKKQARHCRVLSKKGVLPAPPPPDLCDAHWEGLSDTEVESDIETSEGEDNIASEDAKNVFQVLMDAEKEPGNEDATVFMFQRGPNHTERHRRRKRATERDLKKAARARQVSDSSKW